MGGTSILNTKKLSIIIWGEDFESLALFLYKISIIYKIII
jgi:hypothetical protein